MKFVIASLVAGSALLGSTIAQEAKSEKAPAKEAEVAAGPRLAWEEDFAEAKKAAGEKKLDLLMDFTGSDWCEFCIQLKKEVLDQPAFAAAVKDKFVFVELDFPQQKKQDAKIAAQNEKLSEEYKIQGYPTIILADSTGLAYGRAGYEEGGVAAFLKNLAELQELRAKRDAGMEKAAKLEGLEKAKALHEAISVLDPEIVGLFYGKVRAEIISLDKDDALGMKKQEAYEKSLTALNEQLEKHMAENKTTEFEAAIDTFVLDNKPEGLKLQEVLLMKLMVYGEGKLDKAEALVDQVIKIKEDSPLAEQARDIHEQIQSLKKKEKEDAAAPAPASAPAPAPDEEKKAPADAGRK